MKDICPSCRDYWKERHEAAAAKYHRLRQHILTCAYRRNGTPAYEHVLASFDKREDKERREKKRAQVTADFEPMDFGDVMNEMKRRP